jgi:DNA-directed RNA polymerase alpha subunit
VISSYTKMFIFDESYIDRSLLTELDEISDTTWTDDTELKEVKKTPIDSLSGLSERTRNALIKNEIEFVEDLETRTRSELISLKWVGKKAVDEIQDALAKEWKQLWSKK